MATEPRGILVPAYDRPGHPTRSDGAIEPTNETTRPTAGRTGPVGPSRTATALIQTCQASPETGQKSGDLLCRIWLF